MIPERGRVLGLDLGSVRIGVAISDTEQRVSGALVTVPVGAVPVAVRRALVQLVVDEEAVGVVVGLPLSLDGSVGPAARRVLDEIEALAATLGAAVPIETVDERFTTVAANQAMRAGGRRGQSARQRVDSVAASLLLQSWLDRRVSARQSSAQSSDSGAR